jgi:hypothetical protein
MIWISFTMCGAPLSMPPVWSAEGVVRRIALPMPLGPAQRIARMGPLRRRFVKVPSKARRTRRGS